MKKWHLAVLILLILIADQALKIWVKTTFQFHEERAVLGNGFRLLFTENEGMAYGLSFGGNLGKIFLTIFRLAAVVFGTFYLGKFIREKYHRGFIICAGLVYAGALGNLIDSCFYGMIFDKGRVYEEAVNGYVNYAGLARFSSDGYSGFLHGNVVDMLYFPILHGRFPEWLPFWGGEDFEFFRPVFNIADAAISVGVIAIFIFQKRFFKQQKQTNKPHTVETTEFTDERAV